MAETTHETHADDLHPGMLVAPPWPCDAWSGPARLTSVMLAGSEVDLIGRYVDGSLFRFVAPCWLPVTILEVSGG